LGCGAQPGCQWVINPGYRTTWYLGLQGPRVKALSLEASALRRSTRELLGQCATQRTDTCGGYQNKQAKFHRQNEQYNLQRCRLSNAFETTNGVENKFQTLYSFVLKNFTLSCWKTIVGKTISKLFSLSFLFSHCTPFLFSPS